MSGMKELLNFPCLHTFKVVGKNNKDFKMSVEKIFFEIDIPEPKVSRDKNFVSFSVTVMVKSYSELESLYKAISKIKDLKFYL